MLSLTFSSAVNLVDDVHTQLTVLKPDLDQCPQTLHSDANGAIRTTTEEPPASSFTAKNGSPRR